ncbi:MAG: hypothetical protein RLZ12_494 [Bacillota bacterium]|jgi:hypothetical protein
MSPYYHQHYKNPYSPQYLASYPLMYNPSIKTSSALIKKGLEYPFVRDLILGIPAAGLASIPLFLFRKPLENFHELMKPYFPYGAIFYALMQVFRTTDQPVFSQLKGDVVTAWHEKSLRSLLNLLTNLLSHPRFVALLTTLSPLLPVIANIIPLAGPLATGLWLAYIFLSLINYLYQNQQIIPNAITLIKSMLSNPTEGIATAKATLLNYFAPIFNDPNLPKVPAELAQISPESLVTETLPNIPTTLTDLKLKSEDILDSFSELSSPGLSGSETGSSPLSFIPSIPSSASDLSSPGPSGSETGRAPLSFTPFTPSFPSSASDLSSPGPLSYAPLTPSFGYHNIASIPSNPVFYDIDEEPGQLT